MSTSSETEDFMPKLLDLFTKFSAVIPKDDEDFKRFEKIEKEFESIKGLHLFPRIKLLEHTLLNISALERPLRKIISGAEHTRTPDAMAIKYALDLMDQKVKELKDAAVGVHPMPPPVAPPIRLSLPDQLVVVEKMSSEEWTERRVEDLIHESPAMASIRRSYEELESTELKMCCLSLSVFPENCVIKKRPLIYWWIGEGFVRSTQEKPAEVAGEEIFAELLTLGFTQSHFDEDASKAVVKSCKMHPWIRHMLISLAQEACLFHFDSRQPRMPQACRRACLKFGNTTLGQGMEGRHDLWTVFNVNRQHLSLESEWISKLKRIRVLQLGRWQHLATYQIQVDNGEFLKGLVDHKHLKYLSLRGISRITQLPPAVFNLFSLEILDLRACHHLAVLPPDISSLRKLTHLDVSECYFLRSMPSGINKLTNLQVLKGFVIRDLSRTGCPIRDLSELKVLRRLSIHIGNEAVVEDGEFETLKDISSLRHLKISWGVASKDLKDKISAQSKLLRFPPFLEKLDLQGIPLLYLPDLLNPSQLKILKKLYIRGGELVSFSSEQIRRESDKWTVEILRLKYLSNLRIDWPTMEKNFPRLNRKNLEIIKCPKIIGVDKYDNNIVFQHGEI